MRQITLAILTLLLVPEQGMAASAGGHPATGVVEMFDFDDAFGLLTRTVSGVPRAKPNPALEAVDRWRASAEAFTLKFAVSRGGNGTESFATRSVYEDEIGQVHVRLSQTIAGLPVVGTEIVVHADLETGKVLGVNGRFAIDRGLVRSSRLSARVAIGAAMSEYGFPTARIEGASELTYIIDKHNAIRLAWTNLVSYYSEQGLELDRIYADATTGAAVARHPQVRRAKNREIYDCLDQDVSWSGCTFLFGEGGFSSSQKAMAAYTNAGIVWDYFSAKHNRDGTNGAGIVLRQGINFGSNGTRDTGWFPIGTYTAITYGDGVGYYSPEPVYSLDIVAHEFTHGVVHYATNGLPYIAEQGAIDEGLSDIFAVATEAYHGGSADWLIGDDVYLLDDAMRYLNDPATQSGHTDYYPARTFGVDETHRNSGIIGLAFYLLSQGGSHPRRPSVSVASQSIARAEKIFYRALAAYMTSSTSFRDLEAYTLKAASYLYGFQSSTYNAVAGAWLAVGNHWDVYGANLPLGASWWSSEYDSSISAVHTGQLWGGDFDLFLERKNGSNWVEYASLEGSVAKKVIEAYPSPGRFRWRVDKVRGSGSSTLFELAWNRPY